LISFILNIKKDFDYLSFTSLWPNNSERLRSGLQLFYSLFPAFPSSNFMFVLSQIVYGNMALIFRSHFHGYNKNEIFAARPPRFIRDSSLIRPVAFDKCLFLKIPRIVCPSSDFNVTHVLVYATKKGGI
jgi:hypothetical protein